MNENNYPYLNLKEKESVENYLKQAIESGKVNVSSAVPREIFEDISKKYKKNTLEYNQSLKNAEVVLYEVKENLLADSTLVNNYLVAPGDIIYKSPDGQYKTMFSDNKTALFDYFNLDINQTYDLARHELGVTAVSVDDLVAANDSLLESIVPENYLISYQKALEFNGVAYAVKEYNDKNSVIVINRADKDVAEKLGRQLSRMPEKERADIVKAIDTVEREKSVEKENLQKKLEAVALTDAAKYRADYARDMYNGAKLEGLSAEQLKDYKNDIEVAGISISGVSITDSSIEEKDEKDEERLTYGSSAFDKIMDTEQKPITTDDINQIYDYDEKYGERERRPEDEY